MANINLMGVNIYVSDKEHIWFTCSYVDGNRVINKDILDCVYDKSIIIPSTLKANTDLVCVKQKYDTRGIVVLSDIKVIVNKYKNKFDNKAVLGIGDVFYELGSSVFALCRHEIIKYHILDIIANGDKDELQQVIIDYTRHNLKDRVLYKMKITDLIGFIHGQLPELIYDEILINAPSKVSNGVNYLN